MAQLDHVAASHGSTLKRSHSGGVPVFPHPHFLSTSPLHLSNLSRSSLPNGRDDAQASVELDLEEHMRLKRMSETPPGCWPFFKRPSRKRSFFRVADFWSQFASSSLQQHALPDSKGKRGQTKPNQGSPLRRLSFDEKESRRAVVVVRKSVSAVHGGDRSKEGVMISAKESSSSPTNLVLKMEARLRMEHLRVDTSASPLSDDAALCYTPSGAGGGNQAFSDSESKDEVEELRADAAEWGVPAIPLTRLREATNNFSDDLKIGEGGFGVVYKGCCSVDGSKWAVKRGKLKTPVVGLHAFRLEVQLAAQIHHPNIASLLGFCVDEGEQILIYEYVPRGDLKQRFHSSQAEGGSVMTIEERLRIASSAAGGLAYLHSLPDPMVHRDIKPENILLLPDNEVKLADFGLLRKIPRASIGARSLQRLLTRHVAGTFRYLDPKFVASKEVTLEADVYSFGVVLLELLTGICNIGQGPDILTRRQHIPTILERDEATLVDPALRALETATNTQNYGSTLWLMADLAALCTQMNSSKRPSMAQVHALLQEACSQQGPYHTMPLAYFQTPTTLDTIVTNLRLFAKPDACSRTSSL